MKSNLYSAIFILSLYFISERIIAQSPDWQWAGAIGGDNTRDGGYPVTNSTVVDTTDGAMYTTGYFVGMVDFDPGPGQHVVQTIGATDLFVIKLDADGLFVWVKIVAGEGAGISGSAIRLSYPDRLIIGGSFSTQADFDPGSAIFHVWSSGESDAFVLELDTEGNFEWVGTYGGILATCGILAIDVNSLTGEIYTTGYLAGEADFDPGPGSFVLGSNDHQYNAFYAKYDEAGSFLWAGSIMGNSAWEFQTGTAIRVNSITGDVYVLGNYFGTCDFDFGPLDYLHTAIGESDFFLLQVDSTGDFEWVHSFGGHYTDESTSMDLGTGANADVYVTGIFASTIDFDPGPGVHFLYSGGMYILKLTAAGNFVWAGQITVFPTQLIIDKLHQETVYVTGGFGGTVDFDMSADVYEVTTEGGLDIYVCKIDSAGNFIWVKPAGGAESEYGLALAVDQHSNVHVAGYMQSAVILFDGDQLTNIGDPNAFLAKLISCTSTVTNTNNAGYGSLRDCVLCARSGDTIDFMLTLPNQITLTSGEIAIHFDLVLDGPGPYSLTLSGNNQSRIFNLDEDVYFTIEGLSLIDCRAGTNGGAVYANGFLSLMNIVLENNFENMIPKALTLPATGSLTIQQMVEIKQ